MRNELTIIRCLAYLLLLTANTSTAQELRSLKVDRELKGQRYRIGLNLSEQVSEVELDVDPTIVTSSVSADIDGNPGDELVIYSAKDSRWLAFKYQNGEFVKAKKLSQKIPIDAHFSAVGESLRAVPFWIRQNSLKSILSHDSGDKEGTVSFKLPSGFSQVAEILGSGVFDVAKGPALIAHSSQAAVVGILNCSLETHSCTLPCSFAVTGFASLERAWIGDFNQDSFSDVLLHPGTNWGYRPLIRLGEQWNILYGQGNGNFSTPVLFSEIPLFDKKLNFFGSFTNRGREEMFVLSPGSATVWYVGREDSNTIEVPLDFPSLGKLKQISAGDFDGDGILSFIGWDENSKNWKEINIERGKKVSEPQGPYVCNGYTPLLERYRWGRAWFLECSPGYALYETDDPSSSGGRAANSRHIPGVCCPLPADDILSEEKQEVTDVCPEDFIVTGALDAVVEGKGVYNLRCTKINTKRYQLGEIKSGTYWGIGTSMSWSKEGLQREDLPAAIKMAVGRQSFSEWDNDGCIGSPVGSLWSGKRIANNSCEQVVFRELQYKGLDGDPPRGTPVTMFPECEEVIGVFDPRSGCL